MDRASQAALASVFVGALVLGLKFLAYWVTGSIALYSDALESIINVLAAGAAFIALRVSSQPADANHPYGHTKAEYFSAVFEGLLVVLAALSILREAYSGLLDPQPLDAPALGLAISGSRRPSTAPGAGPCCAGVAASAPRRWSRTAGTS